MSPIRTFTNGSRRHHLLASLPAVVVALLHLALVSVISDGFVPTGVTIRKDRFCKQQLDTIPSISSSTLRIGGNDYDENAELLEKARRLREEASLMENDLRAAGATPSSSTADFPVVVVNRQLEESKWSLSYRFSSQPAPKDDDNVRGDREEPRRPMTFYSGTIHLVLKEDGYSENLTQKGAIKKENDIEIVTIWGWDFENSIEDNLDYLLFSMDVKFPDSDPELPNQTERYYFQARVEQDTSTAGIELKEGTITMKKDITEKTGGMWGLFNVAGILSQFRYCGDFVARPSQ